MFFYLLVVFFVYGIFLFMRHQDRQARQAFAARLTAIYRLRSEFWRVRVWAQDARERGDAKAGGRFGRQAVELVAQVTRESTQLRRDFQPFAEEIGWTAGMMDDELADMGSAVASPELREYDRWITGRGRTPVEAALNPRPGMDEDALSGWIHMVIGGILGALGGFTAWMITYRGRVDAPMSAMALYIVIGAVVLGHVGREVKGTLWRTLFSAERPLGW